MKIIKKYIVKKIVIRAFSINLGVTGIIPPLLSAWLPVIIITVVGGILFYKKAYKI